MAVVAMLSPVNGRITSVDSDILIENLKQTEDYVQRLCKLSRRGWYEKGNNSQTLSVQD